MATGSNQCGCPSTRGGVANLVNARSTTSSGQRVLAPRDRLTLWTLVSSLSSCGIAKPKTKTVSCRHTAQAAQPSSCSNHIRPRSNCCHLRRGVQLSFPFLFRPLAPPYPLNERHPGRPAHCRRPCRTSNLCEKRVAGWEGKKSLPRKGNLFFSEIASKPNPGCPSTVIRFLSRRRCNAIVKRGLGERR